VGLPLFSYEGWKLALIFCVLSVFVSSFISNTATVNLLVPLAVSLPGQNPVLLAIIVALASSFDIPLPVATPPLAMAYGTQEVSVKEMLKAGIPIILIANFLILFGIQWMVLHVLHLS
jgi:sodium-dependent dicarboxylate transporter 2/3/5